MSDDHQGVRNHLGSISPSDGPHPLADLQPQQSEATFEAWAEQHFKNSSIMRHIAIAKYSDLEVCWHAALRSRQVAPEVAESIAIAAADHARDCVVCTEYLSSDEHHETYECMQAVIREVIAQLGKSGGSNV